MPTDAEITTAIDQIRASLLALTPALRWLDGAGMVDNALVSRRNLALGQLEAFRASANVGYPAVLGTVRNIGDWIHGQYHRVPNVPSDETRAFACAHIGRASSLIYALWTSRIDTQLGRPEPLPGVRLADYITFTAAEVMAAA